MNRLIVGAVAAIVLVAGSWFGLRWIKGMQAQIASLSVEKAEVERRAITAEASITELYARLESEQQHRVAAEAALTTARQRAADRVSVFNRHRFGELLQAKPGLIERRMNDATAKVWADIEADSR